MPSGDRPDPVGLLEAQNVTREPDLVPVRHGRMLVSPFTFDARGLARDFKNELLAQVAADSWTDPRRGRILMACRSIVLRILEAARRERPIPTNPVRDVEAPKPRINPVRIFGHERRRTFTPEEFGRFLAACRPFYRDHFLAQVGTGLRSGELLGLRGGVGPLTSTLMCCRAHIGHRVDRS